MVDFWAAAADAYHARRVTEEQTVRAQFQAQFPGLAVRVGVQSRWGTMWRRGGHYAQ